MVTICYGAPILGVTVFYAFFPSCSTNSTLMILVIKPFDSEKNDPVLLLSCVVVVLGLGL